MLLGEVRDEAAARRLLDRIIPVALGARPRATVVVGVPLYTVASSQGEIAYAVTAGFFAAGTAESVRAVLGQGGRTLEQSAAYQRALLEIESSLGSYLYADLESLLAAFEDELSPEGRHAARAVRSLISMRCKKAA